MNRDEMLAYLQDSVRSGRIDGSVYQVVRDYVSDAAPTLTCHAVHSDTAADDELVCSECGALVGVEREDGNLLFCSRYCECCGARVVIG